MTTFLALYHGDTVNSSEILAITADPRVVGDFAARLLKEEAPRRSGDPVITSIDKGRRKALKAVRDEGA